MIGKPDTADANPAPFDAVPDAIRAARQYVPADANPADVDQLTALAQALLDRELDSPQALQRWLADYSELTAFISEAGSRRHVAKACDTEDADIDAAFLHWVQTVSPAMEPLHDQLRRKYLDCPHHAALDQPGIDIMTREWRDAVELFREANVPLFVEARKLSVAYDKLVGAMSVDIDGESLTLQQAAAKLESADRPLRESVWKKIAARRLQDRDAIDETFDELLAKRQQIAKNAGHANFRDYQWKSLGRYDYTPDDCHAFADAIEKTVVPKVAELDRRRREHLGIDPLRPWDLAADPRGRDPLHPFDRDGTDALVARSHQLIAQLDAQLGNDFATLKPGRNLDLVSRPGKRAGGFQASMSESREPFIFMNAAGVHRDVETMLHEAGHAFHYVASAANVESVFTRHAPIEFCEVASMSMELLGGPHLGVFYNDADANRARVTHHEGVLRVFPWIATIDQFQHWLYTHPGHTRDQRTQAWLDIRGRFSTGEVDWSGHEDNLAADWQRQLHLFHHPFYYIEYGIAQVGALQVWANFQRDPAAALADYKAALALGSTRSLPDLFAAAGIRLDFTQQTLAPLIDDLAATAEALDAA
ncbi:MAG: M3 family oligoendopeptidase [Planctomycetota bacterium]